MGRLQFQRRRKTGVGIHADAGRRIRQYDWHRARLRVFACLLEVRPSSEGEFVFDAGTSEGSFFYNWSEWSISPVDWFRFGLVGQRTRAYQTDVDIQRGLLVGFSYKKIDFTTYVFNLDLDKPTWVFSVGVSF